MPKAPYMLTDCFISASTQLLLYYLYMYCIICISARMLKFAIILHCNVEPNANLNTVSENSRK